MSDLKAIVEALIYASPDPVTVKALVKLLETESKDDVVAAIEAVKRDYDRPGGLQLVEVAGGYQIVTRPELNEWVRRLFHERTTQKLSVAARRDAGGDRVPATRDRRRRSRRLRRRVRPASSARSSSGRLMQDRRPQGRRRAALSLRHHARVPRPASA